jgi:internalin A
MRLHHFFVLLLVCLFAVPAAAQEQTPYNIALQLIEEARVSGATELDLSDLGLTELPPELWQLNNLRWLNLFYNQLTNLPSEIGQLTKLQALWLNGNSLRELPPEIGQLNQLGVLLIQSNQLSSLPPEIGKLESLISLKLYDNELSELPPEIGHLTNLKELELSWNPLKSLPPEIGQLSSLCYLDLSNTQLSQLPYELGDIFASCEYPELKLYNNPLITPPPEVVAQGTPAILAYLREQAWYHARQIMLSALGGVGILAGVLLLARWRYRRLRKPKPKRGAIV